MKRNFDASLKRILKFEGGYSDDPRDPGGATNLGITRAVLSAWRHRRVSKKEVQKLELGEAAAIYRDRYWDPCRCDELPDGVDFAVFDCAVNQGVGRATRFLQQTVGVTVDGKIGPKTMAAIDKFSSEGLLTEFIARRMQSYGLLQRLFRTYGLGWSRRLIAAHAAALMMARQ